ncbi:hypothetical protein AgCh_035340 [Apium graveolens]
MTNGIRASGFSYMSRVTAHSLYPIQNPNPNFYHPYQYPSLVTPLYTPPPTPTYQYTPAPTPPHVYHHIQPPTEPPYYLYTTPETTYVTTSPMLISDTTKCFLHQMDSKITQLDDKINQMRVLIEERQRSLFKDEETVTTCEVSNSCPVGDVGIKMEDKMTRIIQILEKMGKSCEKSSKLVNKAILGKEVEADVSKLVKDDVLEIIEDCEKSTLQKQSKETGSNMAKLLPAIPVRKVFDDYSESIFPKSSSADVPRVVRCSDRILQECPVIYKTLAVELRSCGRETRISEMIQGIIIEVVVGSEECTESALVKAYSESGQSEYTTWPTSFYRKKQMILGAYFNSVQKNDVDIWNIKSSRYGLHENAKFTSQFLLQTKQSNFRSNELMLPFVPSREMNDICQLRKRIMLSCEEYMKMKYYNATGEASFKQVIEKMYLESENVEMFEGISELHLGGKEKLETEISILRSLNKPSQELCNMIILVEVFEYSLTNRAFEDLNTLPICNAHYKSGTFANTSNYYKKAADWVEYEISLGASLEEHNKETVQAFELNYIPSVDVACRKKFGKKGEERRKDAPVQVLPEFGDVTGVLLPFSPTSYEPVWCLCLKQKGFSDLTETRQRDIYQEIISGLKDFQIGKTTD